MLEHPFVQIGIIVVMVTALNILLKLFLNFIDRKTISSGQFWQKSLVSTLQKPVVYFSWFLVITLSLDIICRHFFPEQCFDTNFITEIGLVLASSWFLLRWKNHWIGQMRIGSREKKSVLTPIQLDLINKSLTILIVLIATILLLEASGRGLQAILAFGGIGGLVLAFASQQVVSNFFGGLMIYLTRPFTIGEWILLPERKLEGYIEEIGWYMTRMRNMEKRPVYIPNSIFTQTYVITPSRMSHFVIKERLALRHVDLSKIPEITQEIQKNLLRNSQIDQNQKIKVVLVQIGLNSVDIEINAHIPSTLQSEFDYIKQKVLIEAVQIVQAQGAQLMSYVSPSGDRFD